jgi:hypothetical protein
MAQTVTNFSKFEISLHFAMTIKGFYLIGQSKDLFHHKIHIDQYYDFKALQLAIAKQYNIINLTSMFSFVIEHQTTHAYVALGIGLQCFKGEDLPDLDAVLDCDEDISITVDSESIRDPAGPKGLPLVGSYYKVFPDYLVSKHLFTTSLGTAHSLQGNYA